LKDSGFNYCTKYRCDIDKCTNHCIGKVYGEPFHNKKLFEKTCRDHICPYCNYDIKPTLEPSCNFCENYRIFCAYPNCKKYINNYDSNKKKKHANRKKFIYACKFHKCTFCSSPKNTNSSCCDHHTCQNPDCDSIAEFKVVPNIF